MLTPAFPVDAMRRALAQLADQQIYLGTSSWKYPGWIGQLYDEQRYLYRGKVAMTRFERDCLAEYAQVFKTVCVDAGYYKFPSPQYIESLCAQVPEGFKFGFKVTDEITTRTFPKLDRHGAKSGQRNEHFLDAELFNRAFLASCEPHREKIGVLIFEFSHFHPRDFERGRDFVEAIDHFFGRLPQGWQYGVEIRNQSLLQPAYFEMLRHHGVTHVYNNWQKMPSVAEQSKLPGSRTVEGFTAARFLLKPGRAYEEAVNHFSPYNVTKEVNEEARVAAADLIQSQIAKGKDPSIKPSFLFINNRLEGNALHTVIAILAKLGLSEALDGLGGGGRVP